MAPPSRLSETLAGLCCAVRNVLVEPHLCKRGAQVLPNGALREQPWAAHRRSGPIWWRTSCGPTRAAMVCAQHLGRRRRQQDIALPSQVHQRMPHQLEARLGMHVAFGAPPPAHAPGEVGRRQRRCGGEGSEEAARLDAGDRCHGLLNVAVELVEPAGCLEHLPAARSPLHGLNERRADGLPQRRRGRPGLRPPARGDDELRGEAPRRQRCGRCGDEAPSDKDLRRDRQA
mmetsp:Transcript_55360/g.160421  ORF Transcript_55360/g.160421 Transcript_55360/m.160421 type:complete len:230 (+) Transcript_55360:268-957(+)